MADIKAGNTHFDLAALARAAKEGGKGLPPVDIWHPEFCGEMDMVIRADGSWWHDGVMITRKPLVKLFASILRKDDDGRTYLVTPVEKIAIQVERGHFLAVESEVDGVGEAQIIRFRTNMDDIISIGPDNPLRVETDNNTLEPSPYIGVRGRLEAMVIRSVFYDLVDRAVEIDVAEGKQLGLYSQNCFFPLGPVNAHLI